MYVLAGKSISNTPLPNQVQTRPTPLTPDGQALPAIGSTSAPIERNVGPLVGFCDELCVLAELGVTHLQFAGAFTLEGTLPTFAHTGGADFELFALLAAPDD